MSAEARTSPLSSSRFGGGPVKVRDVIDASPVRRGDVEISFCVCTADRLPQLERCLQSFAASPVAPDEVIVGDDGRDPAPVQELCERFPFATYVRGPRRGLWANRNSVVRVARGEWLSFLDDDGILGPAFIEIAQELVRTLPPRCIVSGDVDEYGVRTSPSNLRFLGFFGAPPRTRLETVNINACLFPRDAFREVAFDETLAYGQGDADICTRLVAGGYSIRHVPELVNAHVPPARGPVAEADRDRIRELARFYMSLKRYVLWQRRPGHAVAFALVATPHQMLHHLRYGRYAQARRVPRHMATAVRLALRQRAAVRSGVLKGALAATDESTPT